METMKQYLAIFLGFILTLGLEASESNSHSLGWMYATNKWLTSDDGERRLFVQQSSGSPTLIETGIRSNGVFNEVLPKAMLFNYHILNVKNRDNIKAWRFDHVAILQNAGAVRFIENDSDAVDILNRDSLTNTVTALLSLQKVLAFAEMRGSALASPDLFVRPMIREKLFEGPELVMSQDKGRILMEVVLVTELSRHRMMGRRYKFQFGQDGIMKLIGAEDIAGYDLTL